LSSKFSFGTAVNLRPIGNRPSTLSVCLTSGVPPKLDHMVVYVGVDDMLGVLSRVYHWEDANSAIRFRRVAPDPRLLRFTSAMTPFHSRYRKEQRFLAGNGFYESRDKFPIGCP
jgi:hypothetical protein